jgi:hypothetical protein
MPMLISLSPRLSPMPRPSPKIGTGATDGMFGTPMTIPIWEFLAGAADATDGAGTGHGHGHG